MSENTILDPDVRAYQQALDVYWENAQPHFELASRLIQFWRGKLPTQLDGTFSKIMVNVGHSMAQERIPRYIDNLVGQDKIFSLTADNPMAEFFAPQAEAWLNHEMLDESRINIRANIWPTLNSVTTAGTGFRMPFVCHNKVDGKWEPYISSRDVDFFQILMAPNSGLVNPMDRYSEDAMDGFMYIDWWTDDQIKMLSQYKGYNKEGAEEALKSKADANGQYGNDNIDKYRVLGGVSYGGGKKDWRIRMQDIKGVQGRRRVVSWFKRDGLEIYANDYFKIYKGPNPMPNRLLPLCIYKAVPDFKNPYGISDLEMNEDLLIAFLMNFNFRADYLTQVMFPAKWIRADVMQGKSPSEFDYRQDAVHVFPESRQGIRDMVYYDRMPEITPQTFMDEDRMKMMLSEVGGMPNYSKGSPSQGTLENRTATGIVSLIQQAEGRLTAESLALEEFGLRQEGRLLLSMAENVIHRDLFVRLSKPEAGFQWTTIEADALADQYTVHVHGTRHMAQRQQQFQQLMALYPLWNQDPSVDQDELKQRIGEAAGINNLDALLVGSQGAPQGMMGEEAGMAGQAATQDLSQRTRGMQNRNTPQPGTGRMQPAQAF